MGCWSQTELRTLLASIQRAQREFRDIAISTSEELDVDSKKVNDTRT